MNDLIEPMGTNEQPTSNSRRIPRCPVCRSLERDVVIDRLLISDKPAGRPYRLSIARCCECGHEYQVLIWDEEQLNRLYRADTTYYRSDYASIPQSSLLRFNSVLGCLEPYLNPDWLHLDVGGFSGHFSHYMVHHIGESHCLDVSSHLTSGSTGNVKMINKTLLEFASTDSHLQYDFISLNHTLEHLTDLREVKAALSNLLKPGGYLFVEVPDQLDQNESMIDYTLDHLHYFSTNSLFRFLSDGFNIEFLRRFQYTTKVDVGQGFVLRALASKGVDCVANWVEVKRENVRQIIQSIEQIIQDSAGVYVWGSGYHTRLLFSLSEMIHRKTINLIDSDTTRERRVLFGKTVIKPSELEYRAGTYLIVSSFDYRQEIEEAAKAVFPVECIINPYSL